MMAIWKTTTVTFVFISLITILFVWNDQNWYINNKSVEEILKVTVTKSETIGRGNITVKTRTVPVRLDVRSIYDWSIYYTKLFTRYEPGQLIDNNDNCSSDTGNIREGIIRVLNYPLKAGEMYWNLLLLGVTSEIDYNGTEIAKEARNKSKSNFPVFVTAANYRYFQSSQVLFKNIDENVRVKHKDMKLIFYDLGLTDGQRKQLKFYCVKLRMCESRVFNFNKYPPHVRILKGYSWKPIIIQEVIKEYDFVFWIDSSIRFGGDISWLIAKTKERGIQVLQSDGTIAQRTSKITFKALGENLCYFNKHWEIGAAAIAVTRNKFTLDAILRPWTLCALSYGCMVYGNSSKDLPCNVRNKRIHSCHRFDQSVLGIILFRLFHEYLDLFCFKPSKLPNGIDVRKREKYPYFKEIEANISKLL